MDINMHGVKEILTETRIIKGSRRDFVVKTLLIKDVDGRNLRIDLHTDSMSDDSIEQQKQTLKINKGSTL